MKGTFTKAERKSISQKLGKERINQITYQKTIL